MRLKLYLSLLWLAAKEPHDASFPARAWASLLALPDAPGAGARRVAEALKWLHAHRFVELEARPGATNRVTLLNENGTGERYRVPGAVFRTIPNEPQFKQDRERQRYFRIPPTFWTAGWCSDLRGPAVAMLLVLLAEEDGRRSDGVWFSPRIAEERYALSPVTRSKGLTELSDYGLLTIKKSALTGDPFELQRTRNIYFLNHDAFSKGPRSKASIEASSGDVF